MNFVESDAESADSNTAGDVGEKPDRKFSAEELERTNLSEEDIEMKFVESDESNGAGDADEEPDRKFGADDLERTNLSEEDIVVNFVESND